MLVLLIVHAWLLSVFVLLCIAVRGKVGLSEVRLRAPHHGYYGDGLALLGWVLSFWPAVVLGLVFRLDDTYQHARQVFDQPGYESLVHRWYVRYLYPLHWVQKLDRWANTL
jgi:hypothetical protein